MSVHRLAIGQIESVPAEASGIINKARAAAENKVFLW